MPDSDVAADGTAAHDLAHYLRPLRRRAWLIVACVLIGAVVGGAAAVALRPTYKAGTRVLVGALPANQSVTTTGQRTNGTVDMDTEAQLVKSTAIGSAAQTILKSTTPVGSLIGRVTVTVPANTNILRIVCTAHSVSIAKNCASAFATAYLDNRKTTAQNTVNASISAFSSQLKTAISQQKKDLAAQDALPQGSPRKQAAAAAVTADNQSIQNLDSSLNTLRGTPINPGSIVSSATYVGSGSPIRQIAFASLVVVGLLVGIGLAYLREYSDRTVRNRDDVARLGMTVIDEVPQLSRRQRRKSPNADENARVRAAQRVATAVAAVLGEEGGSIYLAPVSTGQEDAPTDRIATELGRFGSRVAVIDPSTAAASAPSAMKGTVLPSGTSGIASGGPDVAAAMRLVEDALSESRYVVITGRNASTGSEAYVLASLSHATVLVAEPGLTARSELREVADQVAVTTSQVVGVVLWRPEHQSRRRRRSSAPGDSRPVPSSTVERIRRPAISGDDDSRRAIDPAR